MTRTCSTSGRASRSRPATTHGSLHYKVQTWAHIPTSQKDANGDWYGDYGGYVAIGCNTKTVKDCPTSFKQMLKTGQGYKIGINNNPTEASAAFSAVYAAALANGGSFNNIKPGIDYFQKLNKEGNFVATIAGPATVQSGATNIVIWWDYLQASEINSLPGYSKSWKVVIPTDAVYAAYYDQAINKGAPDPAAARLWEEYLYSTTGQNLWLKGEARPIELPYLVGNHLAYTPAAGGTAAGAEGDHQVPDPGSADQGQGSCRSRLADRGHLRPVTPAHGGLTVMTVHEVAISGPGVSAPRAGGADGPPAAQAQEGSRRPCGPAHPGDGAVRHLHRSSASGSRPWR